MNRATHDMRPFDLHHRIDRLGATCLALIAATLMISAGCGSTTPRDIGPNQSLQIDGPYRAGSSLLYLDRTREQLFSVAPARSNGPTLDARRTDTGKRPVDIAVAPDATQAFVLNAGSRTLDVFDLDSDGLSRQTVQLDSSYQSITVGPGGDFVLLTFDSENPSSCDISCNLAEVGVVDLRDGVPDSAEFVTIDNQAQELVFAPDFSIDGQSQRLVAALTPSRIFFIDLTALMADDEQNQVRSAPLTISPASQVRVPIDAVFDVQQTTDGDGPNGGGTSQSTDISLFVLTDNGSDVTQIAIRPTANPQSSAKYDISVNQLAAGAAPRDLVVLPTDAGTRLLTIDGQRAQFSLIDVDSGDSNTYDLPITSRATGLLRYTVVTGVSDSGGDEQRRQRVLAYSTNSNLVAVIRPETIALRDDTPTLGQSVEAIRLPAAPRQVRMDETTERERAIAIHDGAGGAGITVLNLRPDRLAAIPLQGSSVSDVQFVGDSAWATFRGAPNIGRLNLENGHPTAWDLPAPASHVLYDTDDQLALVDHARNLGSFTVLDASALTSGEAASDNAIYAEGVFLRDYFQRPL